MSRYKSGWFPSGGIGLDSVLGISAHYCQHLPSFGHLHKEMQLFQSLPTFCREVMADYTAISRAEALCGK